MRPTTPDLIEMYRRMLRIRAFDEAACALLNGGTISGAVHTSSGQEAAAVGACMALRPDDYIAGNHRSHGHPIAKGAALDPLMAELMGKTTGVCKGKGGSMHLADFSIGSLGESGIVGAGIALASGAGLSAQGTTLLDGFADRLRSTPISENGFVGMAIGAAMTGLRPVVDLTVANFIYLAMDQLVNQAAKLRYMTGGQTRVPAVFRAAMWHNNTIAAQHSDRPYSMFMNVPGLKVVVPTTPYDMKGLLKAAIRDDDPVLIFDELSLWFQTGPVPEEEYIIPLGVAAVKRIGRDVTVVAIGSTVAHALAAAEELAAGGISLEVIDPRTLVPLDKRTILESVAKTGRLIVVDLANKTCGAAAEIAAIVAEEAFGSLKAPILRVTTPDVPIPFSAVMEKPLYPSKEKIVAAVPGQLEEKRV